MTRTVLVLLDTGSQQEADAVRRHFEGQNVVLTFGTASAHTPGQRIYAECLVIGSGGKSIEADAVRQVTRVKSASDLERRPAPAPVVPPEPEPEPEPAPEPDEFGEMSRVELIQEAARRWPGARQWATMTTEDLKARMREMAAS